MSSPNSPFRWGNTPFVVGMDGHCHDDFLVTNNPERFSTLEDVSRITSRFRIPNELANAVLLKLFAFYGVDGVFAGSPEKVVDHVRDEACAALIFHPDGKKLTESSQLLQIRKNIMTMIMFSSLPEGVSSGNFRAVPNTGGKVFYLEEDKNLLGFMKPNGIHEAVQYVCEKITNRNDLLERNALSDR